MDQGIFTMESGEVLSRQSSNRRQYKSSLAAFFFVVLLSFGVVSLLLNTLLAQSHPDLEQVGGDSTIKAALHQSLGHGQQPKAELNDGTIHTLAGLNCTRYGGPAQTKDFVYWQDIPADNLHISPFHRKRKGHTSRDEYLTFEPDRGGWNNIRMAMETILAIAFAMGRTLVLPPEKELYLLSKKTKTRHGEEQKTEFTFNDFFHMDSIHNEHAGLDIITMEEFLEREALTGNFVDPNNNQVVFPPGNRTDWNGEPEIIFNWLRQHARMVVWNPEDCIAVFPADASDAAVEDMKHIFGQMLKDNPQFADYVDNPVPVDAPTLDRLKESRAERSEMCLYDQSLQAASVLHFPVDRAMEARLLVNPYQFLFFQDYREDLWLKRFIRDHVRYADEIQCAAARVILAVREKAREHNPSNTDGVFDSIHVRRGDFQYKKTRIEASDIYEMTKRQLPEGTTLYIATDEKDKRFFDPLKKHYHVLFLDHFDKELGNINSNFFAYNDSSKFFPIAGMIEQLVAARGRYFFGTWFSTYTGYINRIRGYIHDVEKRPDYEQGIIDSWYHVLADRYDHMRKYYPIKKSFYAREFPTAWRMIDSNLEEFHKEIAERKVLS